MFGNPSSAGMGQGAAQVFDASGVVNTYARMAMHEQQQRQMEQQQVAKMLAQFDPSKLRAQDIPSFNRKFEELKNLYISNKDLYRNPMKNPQAYRRATELVSELNLQASESKSYQDYGQKVGEVAIKNRNKLAPNFMERFQTWNQMSVEEIKAANGGRLPDFTDVEYIPDEPNPAEMKTLVGAIATSIGARRNTFSFIGHDQDPTIPQYSRRKIQEETIDPGAIPDMANALLMSPSQEQRYEYMWENMDQLEKNKLRLEAVSAFPDVANKMSGTQLAATMDLYKNHRVLERKESVEDDDAAKIALQQQNRKEDKAFSRQMQVNSQSFQREQQGRQLKFEEEKQNWNLKQTREMLSNLQEGARTGDKSKVDQAIAPLYQLAAGLESGIEVIYPSDFKNADDFYSSIASKKVAQAKGGTVSTMNFFDIGKENAKSMYDKKTPAIVFTTLPDENGAKKAFLIDPSKPNMDAGLQSITNLIGSKTSGFAQGFQGFTQPKTTKKK